MNRQTYTLTGIEGDLEYQAGKSVTGTGTGNDKDLEVKVRMTGSRAVQLLQVVADFMMQ